MTSLLQGLILGLVLLPYTQSFGQSIDVVIDARDGQSYRVQNFEGKMWMLDNLNYATDLSLKADDSLPYAPRGRFYHLTELDSVCPTGWTVASKKDWLSYFDKIVSNTEDSSIQIVTNPEFELTKIDLWDKVDLFEKFNPLQIGHTGWVQGGKWIDSKVIPPPNANYWALEPERLEAERTHLHIMGSIGIRMHRHEKNLNPKKEKKLRQFMVRCVQNN